MSSEHPEPNEDPTAGSFLNRTVVVTGMTILTPAREEGHNSSPPDWLDGSCISVPTSPTAESEAVQPVHFVDFEPHVYPDLERAALRRMDRFSQFALAAAYRALEHSGVNLASLRSARCGSVTGSALGGQQTIDDQFTRLMKRGPHRVSPFLVPSMMTNAAAANICVHWGMQGPSLGVAGGITSSSVAISRAAQLIRTGAADLMVCGGSEAYPRFSFYHNHFQNAARITEGGGMLVLESLEFAQARGAEILAEASGFGQARISPSSPDIAVSSAIRRSMEGAIADCGGDPATFDMIVPATPVKHGARIAETTALNAVFGPNSERLIQRDWKRIDGHLLGASGAMDAVLSIECLRELQQGTTVIGNETTTVQQGSPSQPRAAKRVIINSWDDHAGHCCSTIFTCCD